MSREIKFRAWDKILNEFAIIDGIDRDYFFGKETKHRVDNPDWVETYDLIAFLTFKPNDRFLLEQFTERQDTNGVELYDGDIVRVGNDWGLGPQPVWWNTKTASWNVGPQWFLGALCDRNTVEIIGNIHENPELIKS